MRTLRWSRAKIYFMMLVTFFLLLGNIFPKVRNAAIWWTKKSSVQHSIGAAIFHKTMLNKEHIFFCCQLQVDNFLIFCKGEGIYVQKTMDRMQKRTVFLSPVKFFLFFKFLIIFLCGFLCGFNYFFGSCFCLKFQQSKCYSIQSAGNLD